MDVKVKLRSYGEEPGEIWKYMFEKRQLDG